MKKSIRTQVVHKLIASQVRLLRLQLVQVAEALEALADYFDEEEEDG